MLQILTVLVMASPPQPTATQASATLPDGRVLEVTVHSEDLHEGQPAVRISPTLARGAFWSFGDTFQRLIYYGCTQESIPRLENGTLTCPEGSSVVLRPDVTLPDNTQIHPNSHVPPVGPKDNPVIQSPHVFAPWVFPCAILIVALGLLGLWLQKRAIRFPGRPPEASGPPLDRRAWLTLGLLTALAAIIRLLTLGFEPFEQNEFTYYMSGMGHDSIVGVLLDVNGMAQTHPPLPHLLLYAMRPFGNSEFVARLPAALAGIGTIPLLFLLAWRILGARWSAVTAVTSLACINPVLVWYSQDVSPYSLTVFFAVVVLIATDSILRNSSRRRAWWGLIIGSWGLVYTHYYGVHLSIACFLLLGALVVRRETGWKNLGLRTLSAGCILVAGVIPWIPAFAQAYLWSRGHSTEYQRLAGVYHTQMNFGTDLIDVLRLVVGLPLTWRWLAPLGFLLGLGLLRTLPIQRLRLWLLLLPILWFVPFELLNRATFLHQLYGGYYFGIRYLMFLFPVAWLLIGACLSVPQKRLRVAVVLLVGCFLLLGTRETLRLHLTPNKPDIASATALVQKNLADGDAVLVGPAAFYQHPVHYYLSPVQQRDSLRINDFMKTPSWDRNTGWVGLLSELFEPYERTLQSGHIRRVWVIDHTQHLFDRREFSDAPSEHINDVLSTAFECVWTHHFHDVSVRLFVRSLPPEPLRGGRLHFGWSDGPFVRGFQPPWAYAAPGRRVRPGARILLPLQNRPRSLCLRAGTSPPNGHQHVDEEAPGRALLRVRIAGGLPTEIWLEPSFESYRIPVPPDTELPLTIFFELQQPAPGAPRPPEVILDMLTVDVHPTGSVQMECDETSGSP